MEWRIVLGVLCLIGILPVPGNAANDTNATVFEFNLSFSINETFIADYSNMSADATINLKNNITSQIEPLFRNIQNFLRMVIQKFRNGSIVTDSILQFSNGTRPNVTSLKQTLVDRVTNGSFLNIIQNSINIAESVPNLTTTISTPPAVSLPGVNTTNTTAPVTVFNVTFKIADQFIEAYSNLSDPVTQKLESNITTQVFNVYKKKIKSFIRMFIRKFSNGSIVIDGGLEFDKNTTTADVRTVAITLRDAALNKEFNFTVDPESIKVTDPSGNTLPNLTTTISTPPAVSLPGVNTTNTTAPVTVFNVTFKIADQFIEAYSNLSDPVTQKLESNITTQVFNVYKKKIPSFIRMFIRKFSNGSIVIDGGFEFDKNTTTADVRTVAITLRDAALNKEFNFTVDPESIKVTDSSGNTLPNLTTTISTPPAVSLPGVNTTNTTAPVTVFNVTFKIADQFIEAYSNLSDPVTQKLESNITTQVFNVYKKKIKSFIRMFIRKFSNGSIVIDGGLEFDKNTTTADVRTVAITLRDAALNKEFNFTVDPESIKVTDSSGNTSSRSPVLASMLTALWMTLASLLLSTMMHL
ncbi:uncharacterized protein LOC127644165 [Xyrauchen texanus]|uniref:uncharacterized protein LOC127644165 n=1 Tax=Xyrauchen texanus TaxID=154827 RepID=UPI00224225D0|nr:uncharacterized protein LOC127644165 [Xyrauchen texanus]